MAISKRVELLCAALESGEYTQGFGKLCTLDSDGKAQYCCLGVACDIAIKNGLNLRVDQIHHTNDATVIGYDDTTIHLPVSVSTWYGFDHGNPILKHTFQSATNCNDKLRLSFQEIAALFRKTYLGETK